MSKSPLNRRELLAYGGATLLPLLALACSKKELACADTAGLLPTDIDLRNAQLYVDLSADPAKNCSNCQLYKPAAPDTCGGCTLLKGTVHPKGNCKSWAAKIPT
jgi:High potential iron-sulfur protein